MNDSKKHCGFIAIVGRSNVGKSTLLNKLLGKKISITSNKKNTTRSPILGIYTKNGYQLIYIDTPGLHIQEKCFENLVTRQQKVSFINKIDLAIFVVGGIHWTLDDEVIIRNLHKIKIPVILAVNKIDNLRKKTDLLPHIQFLSTKASAFDIVPISAKTGINIDVISSIVEKYLPEGRHFFPPEKTTDCSHNFMVSEIIREKLIRSLGEELPYTVFVDIEYFRYTKCGKYNISAFIFVKHEGQKKIIVGNKGNKLKAIGIKARKDIQKIFKTSGYLKLWVKVKRKT